MDLITNWFRLLLGNAQLVILVLTLVLGLGAVLWIGDLVAPILASVIIAYLLDGIATPLFRLRVPRILAVLVVFLGFLTLLAFIMFAIVPLMSQQATQLVSQIPGMLAELQGVLMRLPHRYPEFISESQVNQVAGAVGFEVMSLGRRMVTASVSSVFGVITLGIYLVLMPLLVFFMLKDKDRLTAWVVEFLPRDHRLLAHVWTDVHRQLGNYVRGKIIEILVVWVATYFTFAVFGLDFAVLLSFLVGISVLIPYVGAIAVTIPVAAVAYVQWGIGPEFTYLMIAYLVVQVLDGNVLVPLLFSEVVNMHPIAIIASVLVFGGLWGFWGVFFAIPLGILIQAVLHAWPRREQIVDDTT
ncbi:MAG: AI-2E family transporter [Immundisolibacterales bacterium]|nr:AI-2E family transporter [Immundisolibacterales bacterium]